jgi:hypothetical protein
MPNEKKTDIFIALWMNYYCNYQRCAGRNNCLDGRVLKNEVQI